MGDAYPELRRASRQRVTAVLKQEEERFFRTIANGMEILESALAALRAGPGRCRATSAFKLHDTFGFPVDLTADVCRERGVAVDTARFEALLDEQRQRARAVGKFKVAQGLEYSGGDSTFHGYETLSHDAAKVTAIYVDGSAVADGARRRRRASSCSTTRRSMPRAAARSATPASCATPPRGCSSTTR